jgi:hypothetical protein
LSGIQTHDPSNQPAKTLASDRTTTVTGDKSDYMHEIKIRDEPVFYLFQKLFG